MELEDAVGVILTGAALLTAIAFTAWATLLRFGHVRPSRHMTRTVAGAVLYAIGYPLWIGSIGIRIWLDPQLDTWPWPLLAAQIVGIPCFVAGNLVERRAVRRAEAAATADASVLSRYHHPPTMPL